MRPHALAVLFALTFCSLPALALEPPCCSLGDVNGDGSVSLTDVGKILGYCNNSQALTAEEAFNADVDGDGTPCTPAPGGGWFDAMLIGSYVGSSISTFPRCGDLNWNGDLEFNNESAGYDYEDLVLLRRHILNIEFITDPLTLSNADASDGVTVTTYDIVLFQKLYFGIEDGVPSCEF
ncbi:MAG: dockerin type I repeat-containing protein [Acidobacteria bacterium]|nr:dockerin type I repeat-containing protein [Acidobacteriota bacterium]